MKIRPFVRLVITASAMFAGSSVIAEPIPERHEPAEESSASSTQAGLRAYIDPLTQRLAPAPELPGEAELRTSSLQRDDSKMWTEPVEGKGILLHTEGQIQMATMARFGNDGSLETTCGSHAHEGHAEPTAAENKQEPQP